MLFISDDRIGQVVETLTRLYASPSASPFLTQPVCHFCLVHIGPTTPHADTCVGSLLIHEIGAAQRAEQAEKERLTALEKGCNLHVDCAIADVEASQRGQSRAYHCHSSDCEDCYPK